MGVFGRKKPPEDPRVEEETAFMMSQFAALQQQQQFLEEQRQKLVEKQGFDFQGLLSALQAQNEQQQQAYADVLSRSQSTLGTISANNQQLQEVLQQQAQTRTEQATGMARDVNRSGQAVRQAGQDIQQQTQQATGAANQRSAGIVSGITQGTDPFGMASRQQQLESLAAGTEMELNQDRQRLMSGVLSRERRGRERQQTSRANLRGQTATPQPQAPRGVPRQQVTRNTQADREFFMSRLPQNQVGPQPTRDQQELANRNLNRNKLRISGPTPRTMTDEELELLAMQQRQRQFAGPLSLRMPSRPARRL